MLMLLMQRNDAVQYFSCNAFFLKKKKKRLFHAVGRHLQVVDQLGVLQ